MRAAVAARARAHSLSRSPVVRAERIQSQLVAAESTQARGTHHAGLGRLVGEYAGKTLTDKLTHGQTDRQTDGRNDGGGPQVDSGLVGVGQEAVGREGEAAVAEAGDGEEGAGAELPEAARPQLRRVVVVGANDGIHDGRAADQPEDEVQRNDGRNCTDGAVRLVASGQRCS